MLDRYPLCRSLIDAQPHASEPDAPFRQKLTRYGISPGDPTDVLWTVEKLLVGRTGQAVGRFTPDVTPNNPLITKAIEQELGN